VLRRDRRHSREVAELHAAYLLTTGAWSMHRASFEALTGRKTDYWLVRTVGGLAVACALTLGASAVRGQKSPELQLLAAAQAVVFIAAGLYAARNESRLYLGDVVVQAAGLPSWFIRWRSEPHT
jgi:hypothetical protein